MDNILNITNGDSAVSIMKMAGLPGTFLPWRDVLHEGPVPATLSLPALSDIRAQYITSMNWGTATSIEQGFHERDSILASHDRYTKVILWFEHDLYDQLQLLQILDWFSSHKSSSTELTMICTDRYLGTLSSAEMTALLKHERTVSAEQIQLAVMAWSAFRSSTPESWCELLKTDTSVLPFLHSAIKRMLEEYPACGDGLSRTARQALSIIDSGIKQAGKIFGENQSLEEAIYLGDLSFWGILNEMLSGTSPLISLQDGGKRLETGQGNRLLEITSRGKTVLFGKQHWLNLFKLDRWVGGVHLTPENSWCWDSRSASVRKWY